MYSPARRLLRLLLRAGSLVLREASHRPCGHRHRRFTSAHALHAWDPSRRRRHCRAALAPVAPLAQALPLERSHAGRLQQRASTNPRAHALVVPGAPTLGVSGVGYAAQVISRCAAGLGRQ